MRLSTIRNADWVVITGLGRRFAFSRIDKFQESPQRPTLSGKRLHSV